MKNSLKAAIVALLLTAAVVPAHAFTTPTNLLQAVNVYFTIYSQAPESGTKNFVNHGGFKTSDLIGILSTTGFHKGDLLVRNTPITNVVVDVTNLVAATNTTTVLITNTSTTNISYNLIYNGSLYTNIGSNALVFGTSTQLIGSNVVTLGANTVTYGTNTNSLALGTNTTVTVSNVLNGAAEVIGTNYTFVGNTLSVVPSMTNKTGTATWDIYNKGVLTPIGTNNSFTVATDHIYNLTNLAYFHGETIKNNGVIEFGTTDEIRTLTLSNASSNIRLRGYAHGHIVAVSLGKTNNSPVVYSQDYNWIGNGSGIATNSTPVILDGVVTEQFISH